MIKSDSLRTWIACASYAILHALGNSEIDVVELENSTGVTFGIASYSDQYHCTRLLTPFRTFWEGISTVHKLWGIRLEHVSTLDDVSMFSLLCSIENKSLILGPINMSSLYYLPLSSQYKCADHYIALHMTHEGIYLTDSEGIPNMRIDKDDLKRILNISDIVEAGGRFHAAFVTKDSATLDRPERLREILKSAKCSFRAAEDSGQGGAAFLLCRQIMQEIPASRWAASLYYDLSYYMQRKYMFLMVDTEGIFLRPALKDHIAQQIQCVQKALYLLSVKSYVDAADIMLTLSELETKIPYQWKEWTTQL